MLKTFLLASSIRRSYEKNSIIHWFRTLPLIGKLIPYQAYGNMVVRMFANVFYFCKQVIMFCLLDLIHIFGVFFISMSLGFAEIFNSSGDRFFAHFILCGILIGLLVNTSVFDASQDKYYSIILMRMNAREVVLSDMLFGLLRKLTAYVVMSVPICFILEMSPLVYFALVVSTIMSKFLGAYIKLQFVKNNTLKRYTQIAIVGSVVFFCGFVAMYLMSKMVTPLVVYIFTAVIVLLGVFSLMKLWRYNDYAQVCKYFLTEEKVFVKKSTKQKSAENEKKIAASSLQETYINPNEVSGKTGYAYFNELFYKRHSKILKNRTRLICVVLLVIAVAVVVGLNYLIFKYGETAIPLNLNLCMFSAPFVIYFINSGEAVSNAMFINCDSAMLTYNFYRTPKAILGVFKERLKMLIKLNILPAAIVATIISSVGWFSGYGYGFVVYASIYVIYIAFSVFFSVHRLIIYYLLQPYTDGMVKKSSSYAIVNGITYFVAYMMFTVNIATKISIWKFAIATLIFSAVYIAVALKLVYKFAPKRFKIRRS